MYWSKYWSGLLAATTVIGGALAKPVSIPKSHANNLSKRDFSKEDAENPDKVFQWLQEEALPNTNLVFYSGDQGQKDAQKFIEENEDFDWFWSIFNKENFEDDFDDVEIEKPSNAVAAACSEALARHASGEVRVFNDAGASATSFWNIEKAKLLENSGVTNIYTMADGTTDKDEHTGDLKKPASKVKRDGYSKEDAKNPAKVLEWMKDQENGLALGDLKDKLVFYSGDKGQEDAGKFIDENDDYMWFWTIFSEDNFSGAFDGVEIEDPHSDVAAACSEAMATFATGAVRVFNDAGASPTSFWLTKEKGKLMERSEVTNIYTMKDGTDDTDDYSGDLKKPASKSKRQTSKIAMKF